MYYSLFATKVKRGDQYVDIQYGDPIPEAEQWPYIDLWVEANLYIELNDDEAKERGFNVLVEKQEEPPFVEEPKKISIIDQLKVRSDRKKEKCPYCGKEYLSLKMHINRCKERFR